MLTSIVPDPVPRRKSEFARTTPPEAPRTCRITAWQDAISHHKVVYTYSARNHETRVGTCDLVAITRLVDGGRDGRGGQDEFRAEIDAAKRRGRLSKGRAR